MPRRGWRGGQPPSGPFRLHAASPQARGLLGWWPQRDVAGGGVTRNGVTGAAAVFGAAPTWLADPDLGVAPRLTPSGTQAAAAPFAASALSPTDSIWIAVWCRPLASA